MRKVQNSTATNATAAAEVGVDAVVSVVAAKECNDEGTDKIITISTASITEAHAIVEDTEQIKSFNQEDNNKKLVQFSKNTGTVVGQHQTTANTNSGQIHTIVSPTVSLTPTSTATAARQKLNALCNISNWISFQDNLIDVHHRKGRRLHGLQLPLHPLQLFGWLVLILFGLATYCVLIPSFNATVQGPLYGLITGLYIVHIVSHLTALLSDPADKELRRVHRNDRIVPEFDRSKHTHVIENGRCHLCNIRTSSPRTKHCSVCNKCVGKFDHHCKWLNHCIGSRNYVAFLMCVVSAVVATLVIVAAVIAQIVLYYVQPEWLSFYWCGDTNLSSSQQPTEKSSQSAAVYNASDFINLTLSVSNGTLLLLQEDEDVLEGSGSGIAEDVHTIYNVINGTLPSLLENITTLIDDKAVLLDNLTTTAKPQQLPTVENSQLNTTTSNSVASFAGIGFNDTIFLILIGILGLLAAVTAGLLLHLCFFHIYISFLGLTTYEYIRNHRQVQEAKAKQLQTSQNTSQMQTNLNSTLPKNGAVHFSNDPSQKKTTKALNESSQIYCCASVRHPNNVALDDANALGYFQGHDKSNRESDGDEEMGQTHFHCCANSREYHRRASKTYYMCTLLEEREAPPTTLAGLAQLSAGSISGGGVGPYDTLGSENVNATAYKTFHCCSSFAATASQRRVSTATTKATLVSDLEAAAAQLSANRTRAYLQYTEQCTFCTFRIRSPIISKRTSATSTRTIASSQPSNHSMVATMAMSTAQQQQRETTKVTTAVSGGSAEHQRCCMKSISKHQRWRRKWNCCTNVPDSPDVPNDIITALAFRGTSSGTGVRAKVNATDIPVQFIKTTNGGDSGPPGSRPSSPLRVNSLKRGVSTHTASARNTRTWPVARFRHMMRMLGRYRRPRCHHNQPVNVQRPDQQQHNIPQFQIKPNQIRPLQLQRTYSNGSCQSSQHYYDSSSPQPPSLTPTTTISDLSSEPSMYSYSDSSSNVPTTPQAIETILPTSVIRDDTSMTYHHHHNACGLTLPPALPPPTRRKIPNPTDLEELAETLGFASHPSKIGSNSGGTSSTGSVNNSQRHRLPALNNVYRRQRRKHFLRTRSPTLSPIHESGLSNPTSPQPLRHLTSTSTSSNSNICSPVTTRVASSGVVNNIYSSNEALRKTASNSSLHSLSSNSSST